MDRPDSFVRHHQMIRQAARSLRGVPGLREDVIQVGWLSTIVRAGSTRGVPAAIRSSVRYWKRGGVTNHADALSPGVQEWVTEHDDAGREWLGGNAGGVGVTGAPPETAGGGKVGWAPPRFP